MLHLVAFFLISVVNINAEFKFSIIEGRSNFGLTVLELDLPSLAGFKTTINQRGINYFAEVGVELLEQYIKKVKIKELSGEVRTFLKYKYSLTDTPIGSVTYDLTDIVLDKLKLPYFEIEIDDGIGLKLSL